MVETASSPLPSTASILNLGPSAKILCIADIRGDFEKINEYVKESGASAVIHTGDFGFMDGASPGKMAPRILRHVLTYTPMLTEPNRRKLLEHQNGPTLFSALNPNPSSPSSFRLSQLGRLLSGDLKLSVPVFCVYGPVEDVTVLEKFRTGEFEVENLLILDEAVTRLVDVGGLKLRLLGLGGAIMMHKMFDNGEATGTIAGGNGTVWATALQIGELVDTAERVFDASETRLLVTHGAVGKEGLLSQLAIALKADLTISGALHFRFTASFNEYAVNADADNFRNKLLKSKQAFMEVYTHAKPMLDQYLQSDQNEFLAKAVEVASKIPSTDSQSDEDQVWKNCWNWNLSEATFGKLVLNVKDGRVSAETFSQGLHFGYRQHKKSAPVPGQAAPPRPISSNVTTAAAPSQTPPLGSGPVQPKAPIRKPIGPLAPPTAPKVHETSLVTAQFPAAPTQNRGRFQQGPIPPPASAAPVNRAEPSTTASAPTSALPPKPTQQDRQPLRRDNNGQPLPHANGNAAGNIGRPERSIKTATATVAPVPTPAAAPAPTTDSEAASDNAQPGKKGKARNPREAKVNGTGPAPSAQPPKPKETASKNGSKEKENVKPEPAETNIAETTNGTKEGEEEAADEATTKVSDTNGSSAVRGPPVRNPFTLYIKNLPGSVSEEDLKSLWTDDLLGKITRVKIPNQENKSRSFGYVEFANDEDMQAALANHGKELHGMTPQVSVSNPPTMTGSFRGGRGGSFRGGPSRGAGGRGGGLSRGGGRGGYAGSGGAGGAPSTTTAPAPAAKSNGAEAEGW